MSDLCCCLEGIFLHKHRSLEMFRLRVWILNAASTQCRALTDDDEEVKAGGRFYGTDNS